MIQNFQNKDYLEKKFKEFLEVLGSLFLAKYFSMFYFKIDQTFGKLGETFTNWIVVFHWKYLVVFLFQVFLLEVFFLKEFLEKSLLKCFSRKHCK